MATINHHGVVESIENSCVKVRIIQVSACATCSIKGHCTSADSKEKLITIDTSEASSFEIGERVDVIGSSSMGMQAVWWAFILPFLLLVSVLFGITHFGGNELVASLGSLIMLALYYLVLWINRNKLKAKFIFTIKSLK